MHEQHTDPAAITVFGEAVFAALGVPRADALLCADSLVCANLWGHSSHGLMRLPWYARRLQAGVMRAVTRPQMVIDAGAMAVVGPQLLGMAARKHSAQHPIAEDEMMNECRQCVRSREDY
jgi:LDH2 family malate/lactate/ureidoglycolate dehydrogenase